MTSTLPARKIKSVSTRVRVTAMGASVLQLLLPCASGALLAWSQSGDQWSWLAWVSLIPLAVSASGNRCALEGHCGAFLGGMALHGWGLDWIRTSQGGWGVSGPHAVSWFLLMLYGGVWWCLAYAALRWILLATGLSLVVVLSAVWVLQEAGRKWFFLLIGGSPFPWLQAGLTQVDSAWLQLVDLGGVGLLTALVAMVNGALTTLLGQALRTHRAAGVWTSRRDLVAVALILSVGWAYANWRMFARTDDRLRQVRVCCWAAPCRPDFILNRDEWRLPMAVADFALWPESALVGEFDRRTADETTGSRATLQALAATSGATLFVGCDCQSERGKTRSTAVVFPGHSGIAYYDKVGLVPWSEFESPIAFSGITPRSAGYTKGSTFPVFACRTRSGEKVSVASIICYDACFPEIVRSFFRNTVNCAGPDILLASSAEVADSTGALQRQMLCQTRCRAVECRLPIVRCVDGGTSAVIDARGMVVEQPPSAFRTGPWLTRSVTISDKSSVYRYVGDWPTVASALVILPIVACRMRRRRAASSASETST